MKNRNSNFPIVPIVIGVALLIVVIALIGVLSGGSEENPEILEGVAYLESLELKDPAAVQQVRRDIYQQKLDAQRDKLLRQLTGGEIDPFTMFQDFVVMGDFRVVGFWYRDFLDKDRVLADGGHTIIGFENHAGRTWLGEGLRPMGTVVSGYGNNGTDMSEGVRYKNVFGCYSHGPVLPLNPALCDLLLETALRQKYGEEVKLEPLPDGAETAARSALLKRLTGKDKE